MIYDTIFLTNRYDINVSFVCNMCVCMCIVLYCFVIGLGHSGLGGLSVAASSGDLT